MNEQEKAERIRIFLLEREWLEDIRSVSFLAAGEYNENFLVKAKTRTCVFRINHGSQLGLDEQIAYEYRVLQAVAPSGVTPRPLNCEPRTAGLGGGVLLMEHLQGGPLDYRRDAEKAALVFSRIHALPCHQHDLICQKDPIRDIAAESLGLLRRFADHPLKKEKSRLLDYHDAVLKLADNWGKGFQNEPFCIVNTEVNSGNFIVGRKTTYLVDWEKAVISYRYQDLAHFLVPTTTLWKSDVIFSEAEKMSFLAAYIGFLHCDLSVDEVWEKTRVLERTILLRALSWCFMAYYEYTQSRRPLQNQDTFRKIRGYLENISEFI